jgi:hypothetical protein
VIVAVTFAATARVLTVKLAAVAPAATVTLLGIVALLELEASVTFAPPSAQGHLR